MDRRVGGALAGTLVGLAAWAAGDDGWRAEAREGGVLVDLKDSATADPWVRGQANLAAPPSAVHAALSDVPRYLHFMPRTRRSEWLDADGGPRLAYQRFGAPWPMSDRDSVCRYTEGAAADGGWWMACDAETTPQRPPIAGVIRLEGVHWRWELAPLSDGGTRATYLYLGELGGNLPEFARHKAWREEPVQVLHALGAEVSTRLDGGVGR